MLEHITTKHAVDFVLSAPANIGATITAHHLLYNRNALFQGGINPHFFCLPILKREEHRQALLTAATSGNSKFFLGTDSAPHTIESKESTCGCAGVFTGHAAIELYAEAFEEMNALDKLEGFSSVHGANFYGLPVNKNNLIKLVEENWDVPDAYSFGDKSLKPLRSGDVVKWTVVEQKDKYSVHV